MTAYELADYMDNNIDAWHATEQKHLDNAATMLRQQADRIAELEKDFAWAKDQWNKDRICFESRRNELEKDLALKTRDRDVFGDFTLAYEKRIAELEETINACYAVQKMQAEEVYKGNDRIAELEKLLEHSVGSDCREMRYIQEIENKDVRIAELEKCIEDCYIVQKKQADRKAELEKVLKPIRCIVKDCGNHKHQGGFTGDLCNPCYEFITTGKGVYSQAYRNTQTKPLSDEEIIKIFNKIWVAGGNTNGVMHRFARAIEERHGIK